MFATKRLSKELTKLANNNGYQIHEHLPPGISIASASNLEEWQMDIKVLDDNPIYRGETYRLKFKFSRNYPIGMSLLSHPSHQTITTDTRPEAPEVTFLPLPDRPIPIHPHIYSNGIICLDLLGNQGWSPVQNVESICMSIQSMLTGNHKAERPPGNEEFVRRNTQSPRNINFYYDDNTV